MISKWREMEDDDCEIVYLDNDQEIVRGITLHKFICCILKMDDPQELGDLFGIDDWKKLCNCLLLTFEYFVTLPDLLGELEVICGNLIVKQSSASRQQNVSDDNVNDEQQLYQFRFAYIVQKLKSFIDWVGFDQRGVSDAVIDELADFYRNKMGWMYVCWFNQDHPKKSDFLSNKENALHKWKWLTKNLSSMDLLKKTYSTKTKKIINKIFGQSNENWHYFSTSIWSPEMIAIHLTVIDQVYFQTITLGELRSITWATKREHVTRQQRSTGLLKMTEYWNQICCWVSTVIYLGRDGKLNNLTYQSKKNNDMASKSNSDQLDEWQKMVNKTRNKLFEYFLSVLDELCSMGSMNMAMAVFMGMFSVENHVKKKPERFQQHYHNQFSPVKNYQNYRLYFEQQCYNPKIPYLGCVTKDLATLNEMESIIQLDDDDDKLNDNVHLNWSKMCGLQPVLMTIVENQIIQYDFDSKLHVELITFLLHLSDGDRCQVVMNTDHLFQINPIHQYSNFKNYKYEQMMSMLSLECIEQMMRCSFSHYITGGGGGGSNIYFNTAVRWLKKCNVQKTLTGNVIDKKKHDPNDSSGGKKSSNSAKFDSARKKNKSHSGPANSLFLNRQRRILKKKKKKKPHSASLKRTWRAHDHDGHRHNNRTKIQNRRWSVNYDGDLLMSGDDEMTTSDNSELSNDGLYNLTTINTTVSTFDIFENLNWLTEQIWNNSSIPIRLHFDLEHFCDWFLIDPHHHQSSSTLHNSDEIDQSSTFLHTVLMLIHLFNEWIVQNELNFEMIAVGDGFIHLYIRTTTQQTTVNDNDDDTATTNIQFQLSIRNNGWVDVFDAENDILPMFENDELYSTFKSVFDCYYDDDDKINTSCRETIFKTECKDRNPCWTFTFEFLKLGKNVLRDKINQINNNSDLPQWTVWDVCKWIFTLQLGTHTDTINYMNLLLSHDIDGSVLVDLKVEDLNDIGITKIGHCVKIIKELINMIQ